MTKVGLKASIAGARLVATSAGAAFGPARSAPGVSKLVCDGASGDAGCRQDIDQRGAEFDQQYGSIVVARQLHRSQRISSSPRSFFRSDALYSAIVSRPGDRPS